MAELSVGVIGVGGMGLRHVENLTHRVDRARVVAVADADTGRAEEVAEGCGAMVFGDGARLISDPAVEAVVIASPDPTHASLVAACIEAGKPVLCEKPLATTAALGREIVRLEVAAGRRLVQVGFMRVYDPAHRAVADEVIGGGVGQPVMVRAAHFGPSGPAPRTVGEMLLNSGIHDLHTIRWLTGSEVEEVVGRHVAAESGGTTAVALLLRAANGALSALVVGDGLGGYRVEVEVTGTGGTVRAPLPTLGSGTEAMPWLQRFATAYLIEAAAWVEATVRGSCVGPSAWDGYRSLVVAEAAVEAVLGGQVVRFEPEAVPDLYRG